MLGEGIPGCPSEPRLPEPGLNICSRKVFGLIGRSRWGEGDGGPWLDEKCLGPSPFTELANRADLSNECLVLSSLPLWRWNSWKWILQNLGSSVIVLVLTKMHRTVVVIPSRPGKWSDPKDTKKPHPVENNAVRIDLNEILWNASFRDCKALQCKLLRFQNRSSSRKLRVHDIKFGLHGGVMVITNMHCCRRRLHYPQQEFWGCMMKQRRYVDVLLGLSRTPMFSDRLKASWTEWYWLSYLSGCVKLIKSNMNRARKGNPETAGHRGDRHRRSLEKRDDFASFMR